MLETKILCQWHSSLPSALPLVEEIFQGFSHETVFPPRAEIFSALALCPYDKVKVVILGQDPYHGEGQAHGLAFSVREGVKIPPSLQNIYKEIQRDFQVPAPTQGDLTSWAKQGVFLLNTVLTVAEGQANSHRGIGWEQVTDQILSLLNEKEEPVVFLLWGNDAKKKQKLLTNPRHLVLTSSHPSPLSVYRGFEGCGHFSKANDFLEGAGFPPIVWTSV